MPLPGETTYVAPYVERHSRLTTFFRSLLIIPHWFVVVFYGLAAGISLVISWFAVVITGRYPGGLYAFNAGFARYIARVSAYMLLLTDAYPPFSGNPAQPYPVELQIGPPKERYSRLSAFLRFLPLIVVSIIQYALVFVGFLAVVAAWFVILITGRLPQGLHNAIAFCASYLARSAPYSYLLTESFPSFDGAPKDGAPAEPGAYAGA